MKKAKIKKLIRIAEARMLRSSDKTHDIHHVKRVVKHVKMLIRNKKLNQVQIQALVLAAWWHDVSRTTTKKPSFIIMPLLDDLLSALLLWKETIRCGLFGSITGMATKTIFCKSLGTGRILSKILLTKKNRIMIDILKDADTLDLLNTKRMETLMKITEQSWYYHYGYKTMVWWFLQKNHLLVHTHEARKYIEKLLREFLSWLERQDIFHWHVCRFGHAWIKKNITRGKQLLSCITELNNTTIQMV